MLVLESENAEKNNEEYKHLLTEFDQTFDSKESRKKLFQISENVNNLISIVVQEFTGFRFPDFVAWDIILPPAEYNRQAKCS